MKKLSRLLALILCALLLLSLWGCDLSSNKKEQLSGVWTITLADTAEQAQILLDNIEMYEEELALCDLNSLEYVKIVEFTVDGNYRFAYDVDATMACVRDFYDRSFQRLYDGRSTLGEVYSTDFTSMSWEEFSQYYASNIYGFSDYAALLDSITERSYDIDALSEDLENGTYEIKRNLILFTVTGESHAESVEYTLEGSALKIVYSDGEETYTRSTQGL